MSKQNKWIGSLGKMASGGPASKGGNTYNAPRAGSAPRDTSSTKSNVKKDAIDLSGPNNAVVPDGSSSHNNIDIFTRGIKSRGPYGGPSFASLNNSRQDMQSKDTSSISKFRTPSGK